MRARERARFDMLLDDVLDSLPSRLHDLLDEAPLIVEDRPSRQMMRDLGLPEEEAGMLCGLHSGTPLTERSVEHADLPETIHLFREGIVEEAGGWEPWQDEEGRAQGGREAVTREIRITLLHEIGHHYGLGEDDLAALGYE